MIEFILLAQAFFTPDPRYMTVYGKWADYNVISNVIYSAEESYWTEIELGSGTTMRAPCGGNANCAQPYLAKTAICWVEETDCWFGDSTEEYQDPTILRTFVLECAGSVDCKLNHLPADFCCKLLEVIEEETPSENSC